MPVYARVVRIVNTLLILILVFPRTPFLIHCEITRWHFLPV